MALAIRNLLHDKLRFGLSVVGIGLAIMLILLLNGLTDGLSLQVSAYIDHAPGSVIVGQANVKNLLGGSSFLSATTVADISNTTGVERAIPILLQSAIIDLDAKKEFIYLIGYEPGKGAGPWQLTEGHEPTTDEEIVLDRVKAEQHNLKVGSKLKFLGRQFNIVGLSQDTLSWMSSFVFIRKSAAETLFGLPPGTSSFIFITPVAGGSAEVIAERIQQKISGVQVTPKNAIRQNDINLFVGVIGIPLNLMVVIAFVVGILVIGLIIYTATMDRQREYGVLKAIGARNSFFYRVVTTQAVIVAIGGAVSGLVLALLAGQLIMVLRPQFLVALQPLVLGEALIIGLLMALLAAWLPARYLAKLAPAEIFRK